MAKILPSALVSKVRGSIGKTTFSRNAQGPFSRRRVKTPQTNSAAQIATKQRMRRYMILWNSINDAERKTWNDAAQKLVFPQRTKNLGQTQRLSGMSLFLKVSISRELAGLTHDNTFLGKGSFAKLQGQYMEYDQGLGKLWLGFTSSAAHQGFITLYATAPRPRPLTNWGGKWRSLTTFALVGGKKDYEVDADYVARFGVFKQDYYAGFKLRQLSTTGFPQEDSPLNNVFFE